jgi:hypothetical protein
MYVSNGREVSCGVSYLLLAVSYKSKHFIDLLKPFTQNPRFPALLAKEKEIYDENVWKYSVKGEAVVARCSWLIA